jgi:hypothetical protein
MGCPFVLVLVLVLVLVQNAELERVLPPSGLAGREFTLRDIQRKPSSRNRTIGKPLTR